MDGLEIAIRLAIGVALIGGNAFFVAIEFALTRVRQYPADEFERPRLQRAWEMTQDLEIYLTSCQVGITATSIALGVIAEPALAHVLEPLFGGIGLAGAGLGAVLAFVVINLAHLTHGEQTPTYLGVERTKLVAGYGAAPLQWFTWVIRPAIYVGDHVAKWTLSLFGVEMTGAWLETGTEAIRSRADLRNRLGMLLEEGDLPEERREEVLNALNVDERPVREVATPVEEIVFLDENQSIAENLARVTDGGYSRYPLVRGDAENFVGIVYVPSIVARVDELEAADVTFADLAAPPMTISAETPISHTVDRFQTEHQELALVLDGGEVVGLVTATDALEAVMGEIEDPLDMERDEPDG